MSDSRCQFRLTGGCNNDEFLWKSAASPEKTKRKGTKRSKADAKHEENLSVNTNENLKKKRKKKFKFREEMQGKKDSRKEKKKKNKKNKLALDLDNSLIFSLGSYAAVTAEPGGWSLSSSAEESKRDCVIQDVDKQSKKTGKKVAFDLPPGCIRIKRPKLTSSSLPVCKDHEPLDQEPLRSADCPQSTEMDHDSPQTPNDVSSQDLFITQKKFQASPSEPSSGDGSEEGVSATPQLFKWPHREQPASLKQLKHQGTSRRLQRPEEGWSHGEPDKGQVSPLSQRRGNTAEKQVSPPSGAVDPRSHAQTQTRSRPAAPTTSTVSVSTQTENLSSPRLSSYLSFCQRTGRAARCDDMKPLDLSLPQRTRKDPGLRLKTEDEEKCVKQRPLCCLEIEGDSSRPSSSSVQEDAHGRSWKSADEDNGHCPNGKHDMTQMRAVQMRLNESFFFKPKGERPSPRPESPLMKFSQSREKKHRKSR